MPRLPVPTKLPANAFSTGTMIFATACIVRLVLLHFEPSPIEPLVPVPYIETVYLARSIAAGQGFSNPFGCLSGPTAHLAPVFPYLMSVVYRMFPQGHHQELAIRILRITIVSLIYALLPWLAAKLRLDRRIGLLAGFAGAAIPVFFGPEVREEWESPLSALLLVAGLGMLAGLYGKVSLRQVVATSVVWGIALLNAPTLVLPFVALATVWAWRCRCRIAADWRLIPGLLAPLLFVLTPWTVRNYLVFHQVFFVRQNFGLELHMAFNPLSHATLIDNLENGAYQDHPTRNPQACAQFARFGETAMNRRYKQEALEWIRANRARSARLVMERFVSFWTVASPGHPMKTLGRDLPTLAGLIGLGLCFRRHAFAAKLTGLVLLTYPLPYYVVHFDPRYRYPLHPVILLLSCVLLTEIASIYSRSRVSRRDASPTA
jgi:hypothetical protein